MIAKITVVTVVLNQAEELKQTIESVLKQSYPKLDYIVVDGASTDGSLDVIHEYENDLSAWVSEPDEGVYDAMNKGWAMADQTSYLLFLGAGDRLLSMPSSLPQLVERMTVYYGRVLLEGDREFISHANWRLKLYNALHHQGLMVPKKMHPDPPFDLRFRLYADFDFNQRLMKKGVTFTPLDGLITFASSGGITETTELGEMLDVVQKNFGGWWQKISALGFLLAKLFPLIRELKPIKEGSPK